MPKSTKATTRSFARSAYKKARTLGPIITVEPESRGVDGSQKIGDGQVYVTRAGAVYHPAWCRIVADKWDDDPKGLLVIEAATSGDRRACKSCDDPYAY